jgi:hypothetical protein
MTNFVRDNTSLATGKADLIALGGGDDPTKNLTSAEWNTALQASLDLRGWVKTGLTAGAFTYTTLVVDADGRITGVSTTQVAANSLVGNNTGGSANPANLSATQVRALLGGNLLAVQVLTAASGTYTPTAGTRFAKGWSVGAGGGSGGVPTCSGNQAVAGGGAGGSIVHWTAGSPGGGSTITGGAFTNATTGGAAGTTAPTAGGAGGDATIIVNTSTITSKGGGGGAAGSAAASGFAAGGATQGGSGVSGGTAVLVYANQQPGFPGQNAGASDFSGGAGGSAQPYGSGGPTGANGSAGVVGTGFGAGAGGPCTNGTARAGAAGTGSFHYIEEYS